MKWFHLAVGGLTGTFARYLLTGAVHSALGADFPYGTLTVNLAGCFLIGFLAALAEDKFLLGPSAQLLWMVGFCGAFTTFSTFMLETSNLARDGETWRALLNVLISVAAGFLIFRLGVFLAELF